ncbi:MAG TPA: hypothetical protein VK968_07705 [Roseimicrobium sp.]|nr:hypothetical protein [Roseimicrobium sp.]
MTALAAVDALPGSFADMAGMRTESAPCQSAKGGEAALLGNNADFVPNGPSASDFLPPPTTVKSWYLRSLGREVMKRNGITRRMRWCGSRISRKNDGVNIYSRPDRPYGRVGGVCVCGQSICCPVCAPRIAAFRAEEVAKAYGAALQNGWEVRLETFTAPHQLDLRPNALKIQFEQFSGLWRRFQKHACRREGGAEGHHLAREINWGDVNGWHYHHHRLRYDRPGTFSPDLAKAQWLGVLDGAGLRTEGADRYAYDCGDVGTEAGARYVSKLSTSVEAQYRAIGSEVASSATKGRNINTLLSDYARGDVNAGVIWLNGISCVTAGKVSSVRWSRGLRAKLGMAEVEKSDEQVAQEEVLPSDVWLGSLNQLQWRRVLELRCEFALCCAANQGEDAVNSFLEGIGCGRLNDDDPRQLWAEERKTRSPEFLAS